MDIEAVASWLLCRGVSFVRGLPLLKRIDLTHSGGDPYGWATFCCISSCDVEVRSVVAEGGGLAPEELIADIDRNLVHVGKPGGGIDILNLTALDTYERPSSVEGVHACGGGFRTFLIRFRRPSHPIDPTAFKKRLRDSTWMGSRALPPHLAGYEVQIVIGGDRGTVKASLLEPLTAAEKEGVYVAVYRSSRHEGDVRVRAYVSGERQKELSLDLGQVATCAGFSQKKLYGWKKLAPGLEFDVLAASAGELGPMILDAIAQSPETRAVISGLLDDAVDVVAKETLARLEKRRSNAKTRPRLFVRNGPGPEEEIGLEPIGENEVVLLCGRLEKALRTHFPVFRLVEHTPRDGIDGLIDIQRARDCTVESLATVEFEYDLKNFWAHGHPIRQTNYIICWTLGDMKEGLHNFQFHNDVISYNIQFFGWLARVDIEDHMIWVIALEKLPGLRRA